MTPSLSRNQGGSGESPQVSDLKTSSLLGHSRNVTQPGPSAGILEGSLFPPWGLLGLAVCLRAPAPGVRDGQGSLACRSPWGRKESDLTVRLTPRTKSPRGQSGIVLFSVPAWAGLRWMPPKSTRVRRSWQVEGKIEQILRKRKERNPQALSAAWPVVGGHEKSDPSVLVVLESLLRKSEHLQSVSHLWVSAEVSTLQVYLKCSQEGLGPVYRLLLVQQPIYQELSAYYMIYTGGRDSSQVHWAIVLDPTTTSEAICLWIYAKFTCRHLMPL
ncbi:hypothetical protein CapIbe_015618 [Capra ibex]